MCVIEEFKQTKWTLEKILLHLARLIRDVFIIQPIRRFIHGSFICIGPLSFPVSDTTA